MSTDCIKAEDIQRTWYLVDATDKTLGRLATEIAHRLRGKHKPEFSTHVDAGDYIVVINAKAIKVTGKKAQNKMYYHHSGYIGGLKETNFEKLNAEKPERVIEIAVKGMLPKNTLGRAAMRKLKIYAGAEHPHTAQQPIELVIGE